jgi:hypothetical protein
LPIKGGQTELKTNGKVYVKISWFGGASPKENLWVRTILGKVVYSVDRMPFISIPLMFH